MDTTSMSLKDGISGGGVGGSDTASTSLQTYTDMVVSPEQEFFLYELESSDSGSIGLVLRAIYDGGDVQKFTRALDKRIKHYDKDMEKVCSFHYQGFIEAVNQLLQLKSCAQALKEDTDGINIQLQANSSALVERCSEIVRYRKLQKNIAVAVDSLSLCLPVLEKYAKLEDHMNNKRYYPALKTLEQLEHTYLPQVQKYRFTQKLCESVGKMRERIKEASFSEFTDFLENIRKVSTKIGQVAIRHAAEFHDLDSVASQTKRKAKYGLMTDGADRTVQLADDGAISSEIVVPNAKQRTSGGADDEFSAQDMIDFSPVYRCCHIFTVLGAKDTFDAYYRKQRREQATVILRAPNKLQSSPLEAYVAYLDEVVGFFVVEDHIMQTAPGLVTRSYRDELWELALQQVTRTLNAQFGNCLLPEMMLRIRKLILIFSLTMKGYGFAIVSLYKLLQNFRDQYNEILMTECCAQFERLLASDNYTPMVVSNEEEFRAVITRFPFYKRGLEQHPFPRRFPFSDFVPTMFEQSKTYVRGCLKFMDHLGLSQTEVDDTVRRYANLLLERWSGSLRAYITRKQLTLVQLVQITINMGYLEKSCDSLEQYISKQTNRGESSTSGGGGHLLALKDQVFRDARSEVEQQIDDALRDKVQQMLELANYDWELTTSAGRASDYMTDLINFMQTTFVSFTNLPPVLARHVCMQLCKYLAQRLSALLLDADTKAVSMGALEQFNLDVVQCELFTSQCPVPGFETGTLSITFADISQLLDLCMHNDWSTYLADFGQEHSKYNRVKPQSAVIVLEKIMEFERRNSSFFGGAKGGKDKDRRKLHETVVRQLKMLCT